MTKLGDLAEAKRFMDVKRHVKHRGDRHAPAKNMAFITATGLHWYALLTRSGAELDVEALLNGKGVVAIVPVRREWRRANRYVKRKTEVRYSLLPRYVFIGFGDGLASDYDDEVRAIARIMRELTLVQAVVGWDDRARRLDARQVALFLRDLGEVVAPKWQKHIKSGKEFDIGDEVEITEGPLEGHVVRVDSVMGKQARVILGQLFGAHVGSVLVPLANLMKSA